MKLFISLAIIFSFFNFSSAKEVKSKKRFFPQKYSNVVCKQKYIPMKIEQSLNSHLLTVKFSAQRKIDQFIIQNVRGIEGVTVTKFQEQNRADIQSGEVLTSAVELSDFNGLAYVVFDVAITLDGVVSGHSIPIAVGKLSAEQKAKRARNIKEIKVEIKAKEGTSPMSAPPKKIHEMKVE